MKRLLIMLAITGCAVFTTASHAHEMKHGDMKMDHAKGGGMSHEMMLKRCEQKMVDMKMPPTVTKEQNDQMMDSCMQQMQKEQQEMKGGKK